ncbi:MAG: hypothetical protein ABIR32_20430 [Ilumatobacteraceae bacterium]
MIRFRLIAMSALVLVSTSCAATTIDPSVTEAPAVATTTTLPTGTAAELLPVMLAEVEKLSDIIGSDGKRTEQLEMIQNLFNAVRPEIAATDGLVADSFDASLDLCQKATKFKRPADADKCFKNLTTLSEAYLENHP